MVQYDEAKDGQNDPVEAAWREQPRTANASTQSRMDEPVNPATGGHFPGGGEAAVIKVGDIVSCDDGRRGRVTGFAPNGAARVHLENGQRRIWRLSRLAARDIDLAELHHAERERQLDIQLRQDVEQFVARVGEKRTRELLNLIRSQPA